MKSDCCGADANLYPCTAHEGDIECLFCEGCGKRCRELRKLTPAQVNAIRWPTLEESDRWEKRPFTPLQYIDRVINYALQDLMPEGKDEK